MPSLYSLMLFAHVSGDIGIFIGIGIQLASMAVLRQAQTTGQARVLVRLIRIAETISILSALLTIASGLYMAITVWNLRTGWIAVALASLILLLLPLIRGIVEPRIGTIERMVKDAPDGPFSEALSRRIHDPALRIGLHGVAAVVLGLVFLMTTKPALIGSIAAMVIALALGILSGLPFRLPDISSRPNNRERSR